MKTDAERRPAALWLVEKFGLTAIEARICDNRAFRDACAPASTHTAPVETGAERRPAALWLVESFGLTAIEANRGANRAFRDACAGIRPDAWQAHSAAPA